MQLECAALDFFLAGGAHPGAVQLAMGKRAVDLHHALCIAVTKQGDPGGPSAS